MAHFAKLGADNIVITVHSLHNNELLDKIDNLEVKLEQARSPEPIEPDTATTRYNNISREADAAMKRFTTKLNKEINKNAKSKQSQRQPV